MAVAPRRRRARAAGDQTLNEVQQLVDQLIKENRALRRQVAKLEASGARVTPGRRAANPAEKALSGIKRRLERAMAATTPARRTSRRASASASSTPSRVRRPTSPETAEKRRQALAKARQVRRERRAEAAATGATTE